MALSARAPGIAGPSKGIPVTWAIVVTLVVAGGGVGLTAAVLAPGPSTPVGSVTLTDDLGRTVSVPADPARVVVLGPSVVDLLYRMGLRSQIVGVDCYAASEGGLGDDYSSDQIALWNLTQSMCVQVQPEFVTAQLVNLTPDLVLATTIVAVAEVEEITGEIGVPLVFLQPTSLRGIVRDVTDVGAIFDKPTQAAALNVRLASEIDNASYVTAGATHLPTVLLTYSFDAGGYWTFGPGTFGASLLQITGALSISANATSAYPELTAAQVLSAQPERIVCGTGFGLTVGSYASGEDWSAFSAVQHGNVTGIDSNWLTEPDPTMILEGIPALLAVFHPAAP
jgi:iron complex transport system substrate-binding protein